MRITLAVIAAMLPVTATQACPTAADLADGIVVTSGKPATPITAILRRVSGDLVWHSQVSKMFPDSWSSYSHGGLFLHFTHRESGAGQQVVSYEPPLPPMEAIVPGLEFSTLTTWGDPQGEKVWKGTLTYQVQANDPTQIGDCTYDTIAVQITGKVTYPDGAVKNYSRSKRYIPELALDIDYSVPYHAAPVGWFAKVKKDKAMMADAKTMPQIAEVLAEYGVTP